MEHNFPRLALALRAQVAVACMSRNKVPSSALPAHSAQSSSHGQMIRTSINISINDV